MKTALFIAAVSLAVGGSAFAAERGDGTPPPACMTIAQMKAVPQLKGAKFTPLNIAQYHLMLGAYAATPPIGLPADTDNAILVQLKKRSMVVWMKAECASKTPAMPIGEQFVGILGTIKPVAGESSDADDSKDEMPL